MYTMSLLQRCRLNTYWHCVQRRKVLRKSEQLKTFSNLKNIRPFSNVAINPVRLFDSNSNVKKYLDYLMDQYKHNTWSSNSMIEVIDMKSLGPLFYERIQIVENIQNLQDLGKQDAEIKKLAEEEETEYKNHLQQLDEKLINMMLTNLCKEDYSKIIIEITAGVGGQEAMLFVKDLYDMYTGYLNYLGLEYEVMEADNVGIGGFRRASILVLGQNAYEKLKYEGGVHRVQRIPVTERTGRVHTSTASVAIIPELTDVDITINPEDLKVESMKASGAGGQHVNTTDSAIRITYLPTGSVVSCQVHRSQHKNKEMALIKLRNILYEEQMGKQVSFIAQLRKKQMGLKNRNEKIRTYNYNQDRITDHRLGNGTVHNLKDFMKGGEALEQLEKTLANEMQISLLLEIIKKSMS